MRVSFPKWPRSRRTWALLLLGALVVAWSGRLLWAEHHLRAARRALDRRAYPEARAHLDCCLGVWPQSRTAYLLAAQCARRDGDLDGAERLLADCVRHGVDPSAVAFERDLLDAQWGTLPRPKVELLRRRVERGHPESARILEALAQGYLYTYRLEDAMACLDRWLAYSPGDSQALYLRGLVWEGMGEIDKAGEEYRQAVRRDPDHVAARKRLAQYLVAAGELREGAKLFEELVEHDPGDTESVLGRARCLRSLGRFAEAQGLLDDLIGRGSPPVPALVERARVAQQQADLAGAEKWFREALSRDPHDLETCHGLAQCLRAQDRAEAAREYQDRAGQIERDYDRLVRLHQQSLARPDDPDPPYEAGMICLRNGQKAEARRWFQNVLQRSPHHVGAGQALDQLARD
jgi:tetratricopeptide (TPR) repeat protein